MASRNFTDGAIESLIADWDSETLFQVKAQVEQVLGDPGFDAIRTLVEQATENAMTRLTAGPTREQADYARALGFLSGLQALTEIPERIIEAADAAETKLSKQAEDSAAERT